MSDFEIPARPDVTEMVAIHRVFRNAFAMAPRLVGGVADGDAERAAVVGAFFTTIVRFLHAHQAGEDDLLFPKLLERAPEPELVARINAQHEQVEGTVAATDAALEAWSASGSATDAARVLEALRVLEEATIPHLDEEEALVLPVVAEHITQAEWGQLAGHPAMRTMRPEEVWLTLGLVREQFSDEQKQRMEAAMPPPQLEAWRAVGLPAYKDRVAELVGA